MVNHAKARQANDITIGQAEALDALGRRLAREARGNPIAIHALLIGTSRREQAALLNLWGIPTLSELSEELAKLPGVLHA